MRDDKASISLSLNHLEDPSFRRSWRRSGSRPIVQITSLSGRAEIAAQARRSYLYATLCSLLTYTYDKFTGCSSITDGLANSISQAASDANVIVSITGKTYYTASAEVLPSSTIT